MSKEAMKLALADLKYGLGYNSETMVAHAVEQFEQIVAEAEKQEQKEDFFKQIGNQSMMQLWQNYCDVKVERDELQEKLAKQEQGGWHTHDLYTDADKDRPDVICDSNGQVALGLCKRCGRGEAELETPCDKPKRCDYCKRGLKTMCLCGLNSKQEQGEPVAWMRKPFGEDVEYCEKPFTTDWTPLYTTPQQRTWVGLTDREKSNLWLESRAAIPRFHTYANLVEAKLKEKNNA